MVYPCQSKPIEKIRMNTSEFGNPLLSGEKLNGGDRTATNAMSRGGVVFWLFVHLAVLLSTAALTWNQAFKAWGGFDFSTVQKVETGEKTAKGKAITKMVVVDKATGEQSPMPRFDMSRVNSLIWAGCIGGLVVGILAVLAQRAAPLLGPIYAAFEGLALGGISARMEAEFSGIAMQAFASTMIVMVAMYALFATKMLRATGPFILGVLVCTMGVLGVYIVDALMVTFGGTGLSFVHGNSWSALAFSVFVCALAAFNFTIDFESIEEGIEAKAPAYMNAYAAFGVTVTLVWLYLEILRLLAKVKSRD
jgi:uncharacterized YccA/Bax inhibitor family protein